VYRVFPFQVTKEKDPIKALGLDKSDEGPEE